MKAIYLQYLVKPLAFNVLLSLILNFNNKEINMSPISGMQVLANGVLLPSSFDPSQIEEYQLKASQCQKLKDELLLEFKRSNLIELKELFEKRGKEFLTEMFYADPWKNISYKNKSIFEVALEEMKYNFSEEYLLLVLNYYVAHSEQAKNTNMNLLHVLVRNCSFPNTMNLLKKVVEEHPSMLEDRMNLSNNLDMTPVEMAIRTSYDEKLMNFMLTNYCKRCGILSSENKAKLLSHAEWLSGSGVYSTSLIGEKLMKRIKDLPEEIQ